jgi:CDP-glycerol glycerophosphotransferase (TagB/SpsB family)
MDKNYMTAFGLPASKILRSESPRCDNFFLPVEEKALIRSQLGFDSEYKNVIYMPTHRCEGRCPEKLQGLIEEILKIDEFLCMNKIRIYIKPHFYEKGIALDDVVAKSVFLVSDETADLYKILTVTDALITDYSSVVFDYCLLNRPILFFMPDMDDYFINDREAYFQPNEISDRFNRSSEDLKVDLQKVFGGLSSGSFKLHSPGFDLTAKYQISSRLVSEIICEENAL